MIVNPQKSPAPMTEFSIAVICLQMYHVRTCQLCVLACSFRVLDEVLTIEVDRGILFESS